MSVPEDAELARWKLDRVTTAGAHLMGRVTYQEMAAHWPHSRDPYAAPMNDIPKVVFTRTLDEASWPVTRIARGDLATEIAALKAEPGQDVMVWGGAGFAAAQPLKLVEARGFACGVVVHIYRPVPQPVSS